MYAKLDEIPAMPLQDIKKTKPYGQMHNVKTVDAQRENSIPTTNKVCGGGGGGGGGGGCIMKVVDNLFFKKLMVNSSSMRQFQRVTITYVTENKKNYYEIYISSTMSIVFASFKHLQLPISIKIPFTILQILYICMAATSLNSSL